MIPIREAIRIALSQTNKLPFESISIDSALGRVLAEEVIADCDLPPFDRAQMDGYAVRAEDVSTASRPNEWLIHFYDVDGVEVIPESFITGTFYDTPVGQAEKANAYTPSESAMKKVKKVVVTRHVY
jgi:molybdopterin biosynthesis enzyme